MVAHAPNSHANGKSPAQSAFQMYFGGLEAFGQAYDPFLKGLARTQLEMVRLRQSACPGLHADSQPVPPSAARRRIWSRSRPSSGAPPTRTTPQSMGRVTNALSACMPPSLAALTDEALNNAHDYIAFPDTKEQPRWWSFA